MADLWFELLALVAYGPLVVLVHELGHAALARAGGYRVTSFGIGLGPPLRSFYLGSGVVLHFDRWLLAGGACTAIPTGTPTARRAWFHAGGILAQGALAIGLMLAPEGWLRDRVLAFDLLVAATNLLPWSFRGQASDGWYLWDALLGGLRSASPLHQRAALARMARREEAVGSPVGAVYSRVGVAWADVLAGRPAAADALFVADPPETTLEPWLDGLYHAVQAEWHRAHGRPLGALRAARAGRAVERLPEEAQGLLALAEARALIDLDSAVTAERALARVAGVGGAVGGQASAVLLWASLGGSTEDLEGATWRVLRRVTQAWIDPGDAVLALRAASSELEDRGRIEAARGARRAAEELASRTLSALPDPLAADLRRRLGAAEGAGLFHTESR